MLPILQLLLLVASLLVATPALAQNQDAGVGATADAGDFVVRPGDVLMVKIWPNSELGGEFPVEETGYVYLPILGQVRASGNQIRDLRQQLRQMYSAAMKNPVITVTPVFRVVVSGEVRNPGLYTITPTHTLAEVMSMAGGFTPEANRTAVRLFRGGETIALDGAALIETGGSGAELGLRSGDRIYVPERKRSSVTWQSVTTVLQSATLLVALLSYLGK